MSQTQWDILWQTKKKFDLHPELLAQIEQFAPGKRVLEIGYGTGGDLYYLHKKGFSVCGLETSVVAHQRGRQLFGPRRAQLGDGEHMPYQDDSFHVVFHQGLLEHFKNPKPFLLEQRRVLQPNGILVVDVPHLWNLYTIFRGILQLQGKWYGGWERSYSAEQLCAVLEQTGFEVLSVTYRGIWPHQWGKWLFPEKIVQNVWAKKIARTPILSSFQKICRTLYDSTNLVRLLSSYNLCVVARKRPLRIALDAQNLENLGGGFKKYIHQLEKYIRENSDEPVVISKKSTTLIHKSIDIYHASMNTHRLIFPPFPIVLTVHDVIPLTLGNYFSAARVPLLSKTLFYMRQLYSLWSATVVILTTQHSKQLLRKFFPGPSPTIEVIPMGVSDAFFQKQPVTSTLSKKIGADYILYHGGVAERKNISLLLTAFAELEKHHQHSSKKLQLVLTGTNHLLQPELESLAARLNIPNMVSWIGWVQDSEVLQLVQNAQVIVYPSADEGFGLPILEALASETPVVASDLAVFHTFAQDVPYYFETGNVHALVSALETALSASDSERLRRGHQIAQHFRWQETMKKTYQAYFASLAR